MWLPLLAWASSLADVENEVEHNIATMPTTVSSHVPGNVHCSSASCRRQASGLRRRPPTARCGPFLTMMEPWLPRRPAGATVPPRRGGAARNACSGSAWANTITSSPTMPSRQARSPQTSRSATRPPARPFSSPTLDTGTQALVVAALAGSAANDRHHLTLRTPRAQSRAVSVRRCRNANRPPGSGSTPRPQRPSPVRRARC